MNTQVSPLHGSGKKRALHSSRSDSVSKKLRGDESKQFSFEVEGSELVEVSPMDLARDFQSPPPGKSNGKNESHVFEDLLNSMEMAAEKSTSKSSTISHSVPKETADFVGKNNKSPIVDYTAPKTLEAAAATSASTEKRSSKSPAKVDDTAIRSTAVVDTYPILDFENKTTNETTEKTAVQSAPAKKNNPKKPTKVVEKVNHSVAKEAANVVGDFQPTPSNESSNTKKKSIVKAPKTVTQKSARRFAPEKKKCSPVIGARSRKSSKKRTDEEYEQNLCDNQLCCKVKK
jgi:hypothetical protein